MQRCAQTCPSSCTSWEIRRRALPPSALTAAYPRSLLCPSMRTSQRAHVQCVSLASFWLGVAPTGFWPEVCTSMLHINTELCRELRKQLKCAFLGSKLKITCCDTRYFVRSFYEGLDVRLSFLHVKYKANCRVHILIVLCFPFTAEHLIGHM